MIVSNVYVHNIDSVFNSFYDKKWIEGTLGKELIKHIDKSTVNIVKECIESPFLGDISYKDISGGTKTLIMAYYVQGVVYNGDNMGENCFDWLLMISRLKDIVISLSYSPIFEWYKDTPVVSLNTGVIMRSYDDWSNEFFKNHNNIIKYSDFDIVKWPISLDYDKLTFKIDF